MSYTDSQPETFNRHAPEPPAIPPVSTPATAASTPTDEAALPPTAGESPATTPATAAAGQRPKKSRSPAKAPGGQPANRNAATHGVRSFLALGRLPRGAVYIRRLMGELRRQLEKATADTHGEVSLTHAAVIVSVARHEGRALLLSRYLAMEGDKLKLLERMSMLEAIGRATDARDKAIKSLELDTAVDVSPWAAIERLRAKTALDAHPGQ